ncbi:hypothetical protein HJ526_04915 [Donghicola sp. C2-DW-16]|uniref:Glycosyl transferase family 2 n=1 Tax=Donghicola mangrovi TaxID=2729614 RepID=A0ABX2PCR3_9RHOB|nr:hypothetical protein [Donghicola mangrovi]NVO26751.1 hypothetical protein [Donghicola mangrovi]
MKLNFNAVSSARDFATCSLFGSGHTRLSEVPAKYKTAGYDQNFDADTLWVDAIHVSGKVVLVCPRLNNLSAILKTARFRLDDVRVDAKFREFKRHALIELPAQYPPQKVSVRIGNWCAETEVNASDTETFQSHNVLLTLSKDNSLEWIHDWAKFHAHHQNADAVLFVDNGSAGYGPKEIEDVLRKAGIQKAKVLSIPLPYGPRGERPYLLCDQFLQTCVMNIARLRFLSKARAVLNCDIDELVHTNGLNVFDQAHQSKFGFVRFEGSWRYPSPTLQAEARHSDHTFKREDAKPCPAKWCIVPDRFLGALQWRPHSLEHLPFSDLFKSRTAQFWHCRSISNDWKNYGRLQPKNNTTLDPSFQLAFNGVLRSNAQRE